MIWNTIAHPKMMVSTETPGGDGINLSDVREENESYRLVRFANASKMAFYDVVVAILGCVAREDAPISFKFALVKGDFDSLKRMILNDELICGALVRIMYTAEGVDQRHAELTDAVYLASKNIISLEFFDCSVYLSSDNTLSTGNPFAGEDQSGSGQPAGNLTPPDGSDQNELMP